MFERFREVLAPKVQAGEIKMDKNEKIKFELNINQKSIKILKNQLDQR